MRKLSYIFFISCLFITSVLVRIPNIDRPLSSNYEWVTAHTLVTVVIWQEEGILKHGFNPIYTFSNPNDHFIKCPISGVSDKDGNYYYVSYPPFAFIFPFLIFKLTSTPATPLALQILNIFLHLLCACLIFLIVRVISKDHFSIYSGIAGAAIYLFVPINLWNHTNVYFADILVQVFFLSTLFFYLKYILDKRKRGMLSCIFCISLFLMIYTEWLGVLMASTLFIHSFIIKERKLSIYIILVTTSCIALIIIQYSSIAGLDEYFSTLSSRYTERSGSTGPNSILSLDSHYYLVNMYLRNFFPIFVLIISTVILFIYNQKKITLQYLNQRELLAISLSTIPILLHHYLLFEFTLVHELSLVKSSVPISLCVAALTHRIFKSARRNDLVLIRSLYIFIFISMLSLGVFFYYSHIITPNEYASLRLGSQINETSSPIDTIFFKSSKTQGDFLIKAPNNFVIAPQIQYYSGRCIQVVSHEEEAVNHLIHHGKQQGIIYTIDNPLYKVESVFRVFNPNSVNAN